MDLKFRVAARIAKPVHEVFEAVADPKQLSEYFTTGGAKGRLETGATVTWDFHDFPGAFPVEVVEVVPDEKIQASLKAVVVGLLAALPGPTFKGVPCCLYWPAQPIPGARHSWSSTIAKVPCPGSSA